MERKHKLDFKMIIKRMHFIQMRYVVLIALAVVLISACSVEQLPQNNMNREENSLEDVAFTVKTVFEAVKIDDDFNHEILTGDYDIIKVDGGDLSGERKGNAVVDTGFGNREYWAFTNAYGQLVCVIAAEITLQDEKTEPVTEAGRYFPDEAKVPGVESPVLDEGHVIADALGGVSNAYNITPQDSDLNREGEQAYMEKVILDAKGCQNFVAKITYPDDTTQIPSHYSFTYMIHGEIIHDEFDNGLQGIVLDQSVKITSLDKYKEYVVLQNTTYSSVDLEGWVIVSVRGDQRFTFPSYILEPGTSVKVGDAAQNQDVDFTWMSDQGVWNNSKSDPAELYDVEGRLVDRLDQ